MLCDCCVVWLIVLVLLVWYVTVVVWCFCLWLGVRHFGCFGCLLFGLFWCWCCWFVVWFVVFKHLLVMLLGLLFLVCLVVGGYLLFPILGWCIWYWFGLLWLLADCVCISGLLRFMLWIRLVVGVFGEVGGLTLFIVVVVRLVVIILCLLVWICCLCCLLIVLFIYF